MLWHSIDETNLRVISSVAGIVDARLDFQLQMQRNLVTGKAPDIAEHVGKILRCWLFPTSATVTNVFFFLFSNAFDCIVSLTTLSIDIKTHQLNSLGNAMLFIALSFQPIRVDAADFTFDRSLNK